MSEPAGAPLTQPSTDRPLAWLALAGATVAAVAIWLATGERGPTQLFLPRSIVLSTRSVIVLTGIALASACAITAWRRSVGLVAVGLVLIAMGLSWPLFQANEYAGPIVIGAGRHGVHVNDILALVPLVMGVASIGLGLRARRRAMHTGS